MEEVNVCSITVNSYTRIPYYCQSIPTVREMQDLLAYTGSVAEQVTSAAAAMPG